MRAESLTIRALRVRAVDVPLARPVQTASGSVDSSPLVLIDILTEQGITGCSYLFAYTPLALVPLTRLVANLADALVGRPVAPVSIERDLRKRFRLLGPLGLAGMAIAGVEMAAWDTLARGAGLPLAALLGGEPHPVPAYASLGSMRPEGVVEEALEALERGFRHFKVKIGHGDLAADRTVIEALRDTVGNDATILVDYNQALSVPEAIARARVLADLGVGWIEEPTLAADFAGHARINRESRVPVQMGENWWGPLDAANALAAGATSYAMLDLMKIGGISGWLRSSALCEAAGVPVSSHLFVETSAHLLAITPGAHLLEHLDLAAGVLRRPVAIEGGQAVPLPGPGSGMEWDEEAVARFLVS